MGASLTLPVQHGRLALGMWQGIYLNEHRWGRQAGRRQAGRRQAVCLVGSGCSIPQEVAGGACLLTRPARRARCLPPFPAHCLALATVYLIAPPWPWPLQELRRPPEGGHHSAGAAAGRWAALQRLPVTAAVGRRLWARLAASSL